jgi:hypothetical protein
MKLRKTAEMLGARQEAVKPAGMLGLRKRYKWNYILFLVVDRIFLSDNDLWIGLTRSTA